MKRLRPLLLIALFSASACSGAGGVSSTVPQVTPSLPQAPQSQARATLNERSGGDKDKKDDKDNDKRSDGSVTYAGVVTGCSGPDPACVGAFGIVLARNGTAISGTWTEDFTTPPPPLHDQGTFTGTMTSPTTFTAQFVSPQDAPCTLTVTGTLTSSNINAVYSFNTMNRACFVTGTGTIVLHVVSGKNGDHDDRDGHDGHDGHGDHDH